MASGWDFEYRVWRTSRCPKGMEDAHLFASGDVGEARGYWRQSQDGSWMPADHERGNVSPVMIFRRPAAHPQDGPGGHRLGWTPFGALDGTTDVRCGVWPVVEVDEAAVEAATEVLA